jgi:prepilin-type processing-associated H-X9-DG protein
MTIQFACSCGRHLQADEARVGLRVKCLGCGAEMTVPPGETAAPPAVTVPPKPSPVQGEGPPPRVAADEGEEDGPRPQRRDDKGELDEFPPGAERKMNAMATAALMLGLLAFALEIYLGFFTAAPALVLPILALILPIPALVLGIMALVKIRRSRGRLGGKGRAITGLAVGCLGPVFTLCALWWVRDATARIESQNHLKEMSLVMHNYNDTYGHIPEAMPDPKLRGMTKLSWRVALLPFVNEEKLSRQFHHDEPWDSPHNKPLLTPMPKVFAHPKLPEENAQGLTYYRVFVGPHTPFPPGEIPSFPRSFPDGIANTILIIEAADPVPWTKPDELVYDPNKPLPRLGGHFWQGTNAAMADGHVVTLRIGNGLSEQTLRNAIDPNDGQRLGPDWP